ncbi:hypothetical protein BDZ94DRAFT_1252171 [Collybia nuda]|uniref:Transcription activator of gluconeogenesis ERT1 n=1 Tax=Collybia nuda TaxID=64659 RepID=A0A9P5YE07_9AGAR|nr:hypothetical protein BDZ94DRAFT_1252171 [Collybia nuda]
MDSPPVPVSDISSPVWPRRASRACASCRRDKIRCDGSRPCTGCTKKGFTAEQCIDGCEACRRARVRCEDGKPCSRCRDLNLECAEENFATARHDSPLVSSRTPRTTATERAKLACANCRRDNKKCDDQRPCSRCVARSEECVHIGRGPKLVKLRCEACRQDNKRCDDGRPCKNCVDGEKQCITMPRKGRGHGTRVKVACMSCRRDKIRCDGVRPCASCVRKGFECIERACKACTREGLGDQCPHRNTQPAGSSDNTDGGPETTYRNAQASSSHSHYRSPHVQVMQLPPHPPQPHLPSGPGQRPSHTVYDAVHNSAPGPSSHYYYSPQNPISGPAQPPAPPMIPQYVHEQRPAYYPVIDPNIDNPPSSGANAYPTRTSQTS